MATSMVEIILVEDDPDDAELTLAALRQKITNPVHIAADGEEALAIIFGDKLSAGAQAEGSRVILLDLNLPKIDGLEVLRRVRADQRTRATPVVVMTSSRDERDVIDSYQLGVNGYIVKPVDFAQFAAVVASLGLSLEALSEPPRLGPSSISA